jgi:uncharacterized membrane protein
MPPGGGHGGPPGGGWQPPGGPPGGAPPGGYGPPPGGHGGPPGYGAPPPGGFGGGFAPPPGGIPPQYGAPPAQGGTWSPVEAWGFAWNVVIKRFGAVALPIAIGAFIVSLPLTLLYVSALVVLPAIASELDPDAASLLGIVLPGGAGLVLALLGLYMAGGFVTLALKAARGQPTGLGDLFSGGRFLGSFLVMGILSGILISIGTLLCVIPGYILQYGLSLAAFLIVDQNLSGVDSLKRSWEMTKGHKVNIFLFNLIGIAVIIAGELACLIGVLLVSIPMFLIGNAYIYLRIKGENLPTPT